MLPKSIFRPAMWLSISGGSMKFQSMSLKILSNQYVSAVSLAELIRILGRSQAWIFIPLYLVNIRHMPYVMVGLLFFITAMATLPFSIYGGNLIDRLGRRKAAIWLPPIIMVLLLAMTVTVFLNLPDMVLFVSFILVEPFTSVQGILDNVIITDTTSESERTTAFSVLRIGGNIGFAIGPALGGVLSNMAYGLVFLFPAVATLGELFLYVRYVKETDYVKPAKAEKMQIPVSDRAFIFMSILIASVWFVAGQWGATLTLFWSQVDRISNSLIGILYAINGLVVVFLQIPTNWALAKFKDHQRIALGGFVYSFSFLALAFFSGFLFLVIDVIFITLAENILSPIAFSIVGKMAPPDKRGQYYGAFQLILGLIMPIAPVLGTALLSKFAMNPIMMWGPLMLLGVALSMVVLIFGRRPYAMDRRRPETVKI